MPSGWPSAPSLARTTGAAAGGPVTLAQAVNLALGELLGTYPGMCVFGEDVGRKGGVYGVTKGLQRRFGPARVFDTLLDEQSILGVALGGGLTGLLPVPEIQYLRLPAQRRGSDPRRGRHPAVLLGWPVPQPHGGAGRRATPTRRASAGTSTTTTRSECCATSPDW